MFGPIFNEGKRTQRSFVFTAVDVHLWSPWRRKQRGLWVINKAYLEEAASAGPKSGIVAWQIIRAKGRCFYTGSGRAAAAAIGVR